jgi:hypothetical protein
MPRRSTVRSGSSWPLPERNKLMYFFGASCQRNVPTFREFSSVGAIGQAR